MTRPTAAAAVVLVLLALAVSAAPSHAASTRSLCASVVALRDSPEGCVIGRLYRPQRLRYIRRSANRRWALVRTRAGVAGWIPYRSLCRA